jgi:hypothetical protein
VFGRKSAVEGDASATETAATASVKEGGKGRPTPKRREVEKGRRRPVTAPQSRKEAYRQVRARQRGDRQRQMEGLRAGDERHLPARDQGPVRKYARDFVDTRRSVAEFFLPLALLILILTLVGSAQMKLFGSTLWLALVTLIILDSFVLWFRLRRGLRRAFPDTSTRGAIPYAMVRSMQIRKFRLPPPRPRRGR